MAGIPRTLRRATCPVPTEKEQGKRSGKGIREVRRMTRLTSFFRPARGRRGCGAGMKEKIEIGVRMVYNRMQNAENA